jgi:hypothetical protein
MRIHRPADGAGQRLGLGLVGIAALTGGWFHSGQPTGQNRKPALGKPFLSRQQVAEPAGNPAMLP